MADLIRTGTVQSGMIITDADYPGERLFINHGRFDLAHSISEIETIVEAEVAAWRVQMEAKHHPPPPLDAAPPPPDAPLEPTAGEGI